MSASFNHNLVSNENVKSIIDNFRMSVQIKDGSDVKIDNGELAKKIDHTILKPEAAYADVEIICTEARKFKFASVCVNPYYVPDCRQLLDGSGVDVCTVIGFPLGATTTEVKRFEAEQAAANGAAEIDMVINVGQLKSKAYDFVFNDIQQVAGIAHAKDAILKVIIETALLTDEEKVKACIIAKEAGTDFVKTSTGFSKGGATAEDIALMKFVVGDNVKVKASGGVRTREDALAMIANGADRIGASASVKIIQSL